MTEVGKIIVGFRGMWQDLNCLKSIKENIFFSDLIEDWRRMARPLTGIFKMSVCYKIINF